MKKNVIGHMLAPKEPIGKRISNLHLLARFVCLVLALVIWLAVVDMQSKNEETPSSNGTTTEATA
ncbi:MAG: hypothetical protein IJW92_01030 [Clostridia bacterium]|nr:hypothetical protein [Clostridia bacterium]